jgi:ATP-dependent DNA helicase RecG
MDLDKLDELATRALERIGPGWNAERWEVEHLEFKELPETAHGGAQIKGARERFERGLAETAVCLANADGGAIVVGVRNLAPSRAEALPGVPSSYTQDDFVRIVYRRTQPPIQVVVDERAVEGRRIVVLRVPAGTRSIHATSDGTYKRRVGDRCEPLGPHEHRQLLAARGEYDWSAQPAECGPEALAGAALHLAARRLRGDGHEDLAGLAERDPAGFCRACGLMDGDRVRRAALVLYGSWEAISRWLPQWGALVQSRPTPGSEGSVLLRPGEHGETGLAGLLDHILALLRALTTVQTFRVGSEQVELPDYPQDAVREILANAFGHRDWEAAGAVEVVHSPEELVITSPGGLLPTLRLDRLLHDAAASRNPLLAREMARLRLGELAGLGFDRAFRELARLGKEPPQLHDGPRFTVRLPGGAGDEAFVRFLRSPAFPDSALASDVDVLLTLSLLRHQRTTNANALSPRIQREPIAAERVLQRLMQAGLLTTTAATATRRHPTYRLSPVAVAGMRRAITYRTVSLDRDDGRILRHVQRYGRIANEDVRSYLGCDLATARNRLASLRRRGLLVIAPGSPRRGRYVVYAGTSRVEQALRRLSQDR